MTFVLRPEISLKTLTAPLTFILSPAGERTERSQGHIHSSSPYFTLSHGGRESRVKGRARTFFKTIPGHNHEVTVQKLSCDDHIELPMLFQNLYSHGLIRPSFESKIHFRLADPKPLNL